MMNRTEKTQKMIGLALFTTVALLLSYVESLFPFFAGVPGMKLGLPNLAVVLLLWKYEWKDALLVNLMRIILSGLLFGNMFSILFSICGAIVSFVSMFFLKKYGLSIYGVSMAGAVFHNIGQILVAICIVQTVSVGIYAPVLLITGLITGYFIGMLARILLVHLPK